MVEQQKKPVFPWVLSVCVNILGALVWSHSNILVVIAVILAAFSGVFLGVSVQTNAQARKEALDEESTSEV